MPRRTFWIIYSNVHNWQSTSGALFLMQMVGLNVEQIKSIVDEFRQVIMANSFRKKDRAKGSKRQILIIYEEWELLEMENKQEWVKCFKKCQEKVILKYWELPLCHKNGNLTTMVYFSVSSGMPQFLVGRELHIVIWCSCSPKDFFVNANIFRKHYNVS